MINFKKQLRSLEVETDQVERSCNKAERRVEMLERTLEYVEKGSQGTPDEGVLDTIEEVKGIIRRDKMAEILKEKDRQNNANRVISNEAEVQELEATAKRIEDEIRDLDAKMSECLTRESCDQKVADVLSSIDSVFGGGCEFAAEPAPEVSIYEAPNEQKILAREYW